MMGLFSVIADLSWPRCVLELQVPVCDNIPLSALWIICGLYGVLVYLEPSLYRRASP